jgi:hypothetical protein
VAVGDFNGDGKLDIVTSSNGGALSGDSVNVLLGNGDGTFQAPMSFFLPALPNGTQPFPDAVAVGDFNNDGTLDLAVTARASQSNVSPAYLDIFLGKGDGSFSTGPSFQLPNGPAYSLAVANFTGSKNLDIAVTNFEANSVSLFKGKGDGTFHLTRTLATGPNPVGVAVGDLNGDGKPDLAVANVGDSSVTVFLAKGNSGNFQAGQNYTVGSAPNDVIIADFNRDGHLDLATDNINDNNVSVLLGNGDGTFQAAQNFGTDYSSWWIASGDFNGDGNPDLVTCNRYANDVSVLINDGAWAATAANAAVASGRLAAALEPAELSISLLGAGQRSQPALTPSRPIAPSRPPARAGIAPPLSKATHPSLATGIDGGFVANRHQSDVDAWALEPWSDAICN